MHFLDADGIYRRQKDRHRCSDLRDERDRQTKFTEKLINPAREKHGCSDAKKNRTRVWVSIEGETRQDAATEA